MSEVKDPKIKLFGKTIELPDASAAAEAGGAVSARSCEVAAEDSSNQDPPCSSDSMVEDCNLNRGAEEQESSKCLSSPKPDQPNEDEGSRRHSSEEPKDSNATLLVMEDSNNAPSADSEGGSVKTSKAEEDQGETSNTGEKTLKKPDKILPCPRCNSMDTKFCYFNNYNVNQPRHFCKNCQRYWTAGGTMRNVPVGAGRRKNKNSVSQFRHLTVPEAALHSNGIHHPSLNPNGTVLTFSSDTPLCESMASVLNIVDKTIRNGATHNSEENGCNRPKDEGSRNGLPNCSPFPPCYPGGPPWPFPYSVQWGPGSFPVPFYPASPPPYWGCAVPGPWNVPWVIPSTPTSSGPTSPTLGKHSRDESINPKSADMKEEAAGKESNTEKCLWVPKTLRIDDPGEAAKSSIWATLGIKDGRCDSIGGGSGGLFKAFQKPAKGDDEKKNVLEPSTVLQANPAALSRSLNFHESS